MVLKSIGFDMTLDKFLEYKERFTFVTFDPSDNPTPDPLPVDLWWIWILVLPVCLSLGYIATF